jgi:tRNA G10  N-methylase Trm11
MTTQAWHEFIRFVVTATMFYFAGRVSQRDKDARDEQRRVDRRNAHRYGTQGGRS